MKWNKCDGLIGLPETNGEDVELLLKVDNLPFQYLSVIWDGMYLYQYSGDFSYPWAGVQNQIEFHEWTYIK